MNKKIARETMSTQLVEAGNRLHAAQNEKDLHAAAVALLRLRLVYFAGVEESALRIVELDDVCRELTASAVQQITDWCWSAYQGGMQAMKESFNARSTQ